MVRGDYVQHLGCLIIRLSAILKERRRPEMDQSRALLVDTHQEFVRNLRTAFGDAKVDELSGGDALHASQGPRRARASELADWNNVDRSLIAFLLEPATQHPIFAAKLNFHREIDTNDLRFARILTRVFNDDVETAPSYPAQNELWLSFQQTRFTRAIGRFPSFHTEIFIRWLGTPESAGSLLYEGHLFAARLIMTKQVKWIKENPALTFVKFSDRIPLTQALFEEKWLRALTQDGHVNLVGLGHDRGVIGALFVNGVTEPSNALIAPHGDLDAFCSALVPDTMAFVASTSGDLHVLFANGAVFSKMQGRWYYLNFNVLRNALTRHINITVASAIVRLVLDLSYERRGALIGALSSENDVAGLVPDHSLATRPNRLLRNFARKLDATDPIHLRILRSVAAIDGAVLFSRNGHVLDAACMVGDPGPDALKKAGSPNYGAFQVREPQPLGIAVFTARQ